MFFRTHTHTRAHTHPHATYMHACTSMTLPPPPGIVVARWADEGLPATGIVFVSFHNYFKIDPRTLRMWVRILLRVPGSVLWQISSNEAVRPQLCCVAMLPRWVAMVRSLLTRGNEPRCRRCWVDLLHVGCCMLEPTDTPRPHFL